MTTRLFDLFLIFIGGAFVVQAVLTKPEYYDVMGPALWPLVVAVPMLFVQVVAWVSCCAIPVRAQDRPRTSRRHLLLLGVFCASCAGALHGKSERGLARHDK